MSQTPSPSPSEMTGPNLFERYLEEVKTSMQLNQLQLTASAVSLERCRNAIEWQQAVYQQFTLITQAADMNVCRLDDWGRLLLNQPQASVTDRQTWLSLRDMAVDINQSVKDMYIRSQALQKQLLMLSDAVVQMEHLSAELTRFNDSVGGKVDLFVKTLNQSAPSKRREV